MNPDPLTVDESPLRTDDFESRAWMEARRDAGQPLRAFDWHAARGTAGDWAMARVFVEECARDRDNLLAARSTSKAFFLTLGLAFLGGWVVRGLR